MKIKLIQSGGLISITKEAETDVDWTKEETDNLLKKIKVDNSSSPVRDGLGYTLEINNKEYEVDIDKASGEYAKVLDGLRKGLKVVKG